MMVELVTNIFLRGMDFMIYWNKKTWLWMTRRLQIHEE